MRNRKQYQVKNNGVWVGTDDNRGHMEFDGLKKGIELFLKEKNASSVVDFGCGNGGYSKHLQNKGFDVECYDGNPHTPKNTNYMCKVCDLSEKIELDKKFDFVLSLEVGEHIPKKYEKTFIDNIHRHNKHGIIISWATLNPYQSGIGHVNNQDNKYIIDCFTKLGYTHDLESQNKIKTNIKCKTLWFHESLMVFIRK